MVLRYLHRFGGFAVPMLLAACVSNSGNQWAHVTDTEIGGKRVSVYSTDGVLRSDQGSETGVRFGAVPIVGTCSGSARQAGELMVYTGCENQQWTAMARPRTMEVGVRPDGRVFYRCAVHDPSACQVFVYEDNIVEATRLRASLGQRAYLPVAFERPR